MVAGFQPRENQNPLPRAAGRFDHHPPLASPGAASRSTSALVEPAVGAAMAAPAARTPTPASASRPTTGHGNLHPVCRRCVLRGQHNDDTSDLEQDRHQGWTGYFS